MMERLSQYAVVFLRIALGVTFLSSVADRFGMLGASDSRMSRGGLRSLQRLHRPIKLVPADQYDPRSRMVSHMLGNDPGLYPDCGVVYPRVGRAGGALLLLFALAMTASSGLQSALSHSVYSASAGAFLLAASGHYVWSLDSYGGRISEVGRRMISRPVRS